MPDEQGAFVFELPAAEPGAAQPTQRRPLSPAIGMGLVFLKALVFFGSAEKLQVALSERGKTDAGMLEFRDAFIAWNKQEG